MDRLALLGALPLAMLLGALVFAPGLPPQTTVQAEHDENEDDDGSGTV